MDWECLIVFVCEKWKMAQQLEDNESFGVDVIYEGNFGGVYENFRILNVLVWRCKDTWKIGNIFLNFWKVKSFGV